MDIENLAKELILKNMTPEQQMAVLDSVRQSVLQAKEVQKKKIGENVDLVVQALKKIESDIRSRFDDVGNAIEKRVASIKDGRDGINGTDGRDGKDGKAGRDGAKGDKGDAGKDGRDGVDGVDGVSVTSARIDFDGSLIITLSSGVELNVGEVVAPDLAERIKVITNGGGTSQFVLDTLASLQTQIDNLIPSQTGNAGKYLTTNGIALSWASVAGGLSYQGTWNASTNTPTLTSSVGVNGYYYIVSTAGSTNLDGITDWQIGDWLLFNGTVWQKIDQSNLVTSVNGQTGAVSVGTVTSVAATAGTGITVTGSPITTSGTLTITNTAPDQTVALTAGTGISTSGTYPNFTITNTAPDQTVALTGAGTTSISGTYPNFTITSNDQYVGTVTSVTGTSPVASSGGATPAISLSAGYGDTQNPYASKTANFVLAAPNGSAGVPTFRAIVAADIPTLNQNTTGTASNVTGTVAIANGGTGATTAATALTNLGAVAKAGDTMTGALGFVAGSASTPSLFASGDTNTGIFFPAADTIAFAEGGIEAARFDSSGNLGIGTSSPSYRLEVKGPAATAGQLSIHDGTGDTTVSGVTAASLLFQARDSSVRTIAEIDAVNTTTNGTGGAMVFQTRISDTLAERMRISASGKILFNTTTQNNNEQVGMVYSSNAGVGFSIKDSSAQSGNTFVEFRNGATVAGTITSNGTTTMTYGSASDYRLKENLVPLTGALAKLGSLQPKVGNWKVDGSEFVGFVAHELQEVFPDAVVGEKDKVDADGNPLHQMVDTGSASIIATLTAAIQEQQSLITALTARITALESN